MKSNLEHSALPTADEIRRYHEGELDPHRAHEIEVLSQENPLLAEALEGFSATPAYATVPAINAAIAQTVGIAGTGTSAAASLVGASTPWWHLNGWMIGLIVGSAAAVGTTLYISNDQNTEQKITNDSEKIDLVVVQSTTNSNEQSIPPIISENTTSIKIEAPKNVDKVALNNYASRPTAQDISVIDGSKQDVLPRPVEDENTLPKKSSTVAIKIMHILNYKLADYTEIRTTKWDKFSLDEVGLPANYGSFEERKKYLDEHPEKATPYVEYISQCIKAFDDAKYKLAIQRFGVVLKEYPDDVNAQFYSAMSFYHTSEFEKAIALFAMSEKNMIKTFDEESMFYHAKSLKALGRIEEANAKLEKVILRNGFYIENALKEISGEE